jgi:predicted metal-dependent HD superfamily phosphohydrolase
MSLSAPEWRRLWESLGAQTVPQGLLNQLIRAYSASHRRYHTLLHLRECFAHFDAARSLAPHPEAVELALWFHDAVYDPQRSDNEERSADWAHASILAAGCPAETADRVRGLVLATRHGTAPPDADPDADLLLDIDLAILGSAAARYDDYTREIRAEYAHVPEADFRARRAGVLQGFLNRTRLYRTEVFASALEAQARENLQRELGTILT